MLQRIIDRDSGNAEQQKAADAWIREVGCKRMLEEGRERVSE